MSKSWTARDIPSMNGKRVLITGANSGIGYHAALKLARKGAHVLLACRDRQRGEAALDRLVGEAPGTPSELVLLDLASLAAVREFAANHLARHLPLHLLINNAGVMAPPQRIETADGFELQFGTNVLGHFALTGLLMPALEQAALESAAETTPASGGNSDARSTAWPRIVTIASIAHKRAHLNLADLQYTSGYAPMKTYQQSKLANLMLALELDRRLRARSSPILSVAAHPGVADTALFQKGDYSRFERSIRRALSHAIALLLNTDAEGALPTLYAATSPEAVGGGYYGPQGFQEMRGEHVGPAKVAPQARDTAASAGLWKICEDLTGVSFLN